MEIFIGKVPLTIAGCLGYNYNKTSLAGLQPIKGKIALKLINMGSKRFWQNHQRNQKIALIGRFFVKN